MFYRPIKFMTGIGDTKKQVSHIDWNEYCGALEVQYKGINP